MHAAKMQCNVIPNGLASDDGICDAARVSLAKIASLFSVEQNGKLLRYLKEHQHWSPFGHAREVFTFTLTDESLIRLFSHANLTGFTWEIITSGDGTSSIYLSGSIWAWYENIWTLPDRVADGIRDWYRTSPKYMQAGKLLFREPRHLWNSVLHIESADEEQLYRLSSVSFRVKAPIFVARQLVKHQKDLVWNEESRRYIDSDPDFFVPEVWRARPDGSIKQGSSETDALSSQHYTRGCANEHALGQLQLYDALIGNHVAPELARMVLPQSAMTEWIWTGTPEAWNRVCSLRLDPHAQKETREIAQMIDKGMNEVMPRTWKLLRDDKLRIEGKTLG